MQYDYSKLLGKIKEKCGSHGKFATALGLSERSLSLKLNGKREWKQTEIETAINLLNVNAKDIPIYFFARKVQS